MPCGKLLPAGRHCCCQTRSLLVLWQPFEIVNIPRSQVAAMLGPRSVLQFMPDQNSASPIYGTTEDHDGDHYANGSAGTSTTRVKQCVAKRE